MKTERQVLDRLGASVGMLEAVSPSNTEEMGGASDKQLEAAVLTGFVLAFAWVLDQEDEIDQIAARLQLKDLMARMKERSG